MQAQAMLDLMNRAGADHISQVPGYERQATKNSNSLFQQFADFATNPAVLTAAGGVAGVYAGGAGAAGAQAGEGTYGAGYGVGNATTAGTVGGGSAVSVGGGVSGGAGIGATAEGTVGAGAGAGAGGGIGTAAGTAATGTALSRILDGSGTSEDYLSVTGQVLPAALSAYGSYAQSQEMGDLAKRYEAYGAPYRQNLADISADPSKFYDSPGATKATDAILRKLSIAGNPAGNP